MNQELTKITLLSIKKEHLKLTENKIAKNIGLTCKAKSYLNKESL